MGGEGSEFGTTATAKVEIWSKHVAVLRFFHPVINGSIEELFFYNYS
jgi:hypothetical protein